MVEADKPANTQELISYRYFAEQLDPRAGLPVGLVPLEALREHTPGFFSKGSKYHDVGGGTGASFNYFFQRIPLYLRSRIDCVISEPFNEASEDNLIRFSETLNSFRVLKMEANEAVRQERNCDLVTMINMIHLIPEKTRAQLLTDTFESLNPGGFLVVSTTFIDEWIPSGRFEEINGLHTAWRLAVLREIRSRDNIDFDDLKKRLKEERLKFWTAKEYLDAIKRAGFEIAFSDLLEMPCNVKSYDLISCDDEWLKHTLPGVDLEQAAEISRTSLQRVVEDKGLNYEYSLPRNTLVAVGFRP